jgi:hypothetical protein
MAAIHATCKCGAVLNIDGTPTAIKEAYALFVHMHDHCYGGEAEVEIERVPNMIEDMSTPLKWEDSF